MSPKKIGKKKITSLENINSMISKNFNLEKIKLNPANVLEGTKNKIGN